MASTVTIDIGIPTFTATGTLTHRYTEIVDRMIE